MNAVTLTHQTASPSLEIFETIPAGYLAHAVTDRGCLPMIQPGEVAVVTEQEGLIPEAGGWYLVEYSNGMTYRGRERRLRTICVAHVADLRGEEVWWLRSPAKRSKGITEMSDGPYRDFNDIAEKVLGRVAGLYRPGV